MLNRVWREAEPLGGTGPREGAEPAAGRTLDGWVVPAVAEEVRVGLFFAFLPTMVLHACSVTAAGAEGAWPAVTGATAVDSFDDFSRLGGGTATMAGWEAQGSTGAG